MTNLPTLPRPALYSPDAAPDHASAPICDALLRYSSLDTAPFHTPGHKQATSLPAVLERVLGRRAFQLDLTPLPGLDNLDNPQGIIRNAELLAADLWGADTTWFLTNGSTTGNNAMLLLTCGEGDEVIVPRNAHRSIQGALVLSGARPVYVQPEWDAELGIAHSISPEAVRAALDAHPRARAVLALSPTYYGAVADVAGLAAVCHAHDVPLLVDEAHGAHLGFHPLLPQSALALGADVVVQSTHKTLSASSQCSMLHFRGDRVRPRRDVVGLLQTTSPNYLLLASLDAARHQLAQEGEELVGAAVALAERLRTEVGAIDGLSSFGVERCIGGALHAFDPTKVTVRVSRLGVTGYDVRDLLSARHAIQCEIADRDSITFIVSIGNTDRDVDRVVEAFGRLAREYGAAGSTHARPDDAVATAPLPRDLWEPDVVLTPRRAFFAPTRTMEFERSVGQVAAEIVAPYPPGIPVLAPGERIRQSHVDYLRDVVASGWSVNGPADPLLRTISVVDDPVSTR